jgi:hypothetical protein
VIEHEVELVAQLVGKLIYGSWFRFPISANGSDIEIDHIVDGARLVIVISTSGSIIILRRQPRRSASDDAPPRPGAASRKHPRQRRLADRQRLGHRVPRLRIPGRDPMQERPDLCPRYRRRPIRRCAAQP